MYASYVFGDTPADGTLALGYEPSDDGKSLICTRLEIEIAPSAGGITRALVKSIPLGSHFRDARRTLELNAKLDRAFTAEAQARFGAPVEWPDLPELPEGGRRAGRPQMALAHLRAVAEVYNEADTSGMPPALAVQRHFGCPRRTAMRWIARARTAQLIDTPPRSAGVKTAGGRRSR